MRRVAPISLLTLACAVAASALPGRTAHSEPPATAATPHLREFTLQGARLTLDLAPQVLSLESPKPPADPSLEATLAGAAYAHGFVPAALLVQKAKQFDDGLYAAVEIAAQNGAGTFAGKRALLDALALALADRPPEDGASAILEAAARLGGGHQALPAAMEHAVAAQTQAFERESLRSKPIGFYTETPELSAIFRQDRMLQSELSHGGLDHVVTLLHDDDTLRRTYERYVALVDGMTNPAAAGTTDVRPLLAALDTGSPAPTAKRAFFAPSRAPETDLLARLFPPDAPIPENFSLAAEMARQVHAGTLDLTPRARSGWYDWAIWALEPLAAPDRAAEAPKLKLNANYEHSLGDLFQGTLALTRETHIKNLSIPQAATAAAPPREAVAYFAPQLRAEPLATYYRRRAQGYAFVAGVLRQAFGAAALATLHRNRAQGPVAASLAEELDAMQALFLGAYAAVSDDLGLTAEDGAAAHVAAFETWQANLAQDPDLKRDVRMMVPLYYDAQRRRTKVLVFLGWSRREVTIGFAAPPRLQALAPDSASLPADAETPREVRFVPRYETVFYPVSAEILVPRLLDRDQFRALCDEKRSVAAIVQALQH